MTVDGLINVNGINSRSVVQSGAGSGGSVIVDAGELRGHGSITCNGGNGNRVHHYHNRYISKSQNDPTATESTTITTDISVSLKMTLRQQSPPLSQQIYQ